jgi:hypothetical protein
MIEALRSGALLIALRPHPVGPYARHPEAVRFQSRVQSCSRQFHELRCQAQALKVSLSGAVGIEHAYILEEGSNRTPTLVLSVVHATERHPRIRDGQDKSLSKQRGSSELFCSDAPKQSCQNPRKHWLRSEPIAARNRVRRLPVHIPSQRASELSRFRSVPPDRDDLPYRLCQQSLLGEFGRIAMQTRDHRQILQRATELCAQGLEARFAKVLEYLPDENRLMVRAGDGERILPTAIIERFCLGADGELELMTSGSTGESRPLCTMQAFAG